MTIITLQGEQFTAIESELNAHFSELWQNVDTPNDLELFLDRIRACGLNELAESYVKMFWDGVAEFNKQRAEKEFHNNLFR